MSISTHSIYLDLYPISIHQSRYGGIYEGGEWFCVANSESVPEAAVGDDESCADFFDSPQAKFIGVGDTPNDALMDMLSKHGFLPQEQLVSYEIVSNNFNTVVNTRNAEKINEQNNSLVERNDYFRSANKFSADK